MVNFSETNPDKLSKEAFNQKKVNLEKLRWFRGNDSAVVELATSAEEKLLNILKDPKHSSRDQLLETILKNYSGEAYGDYQWRKTTGGWTTPKVPTIYGEFRNDYNQYAQLSLDAGFISHLPECMELIKKSTLNNPDYLDARNELKEKLGYKILWRGMMLTEDELNDIKQNGIASPFIKYIETIEQPKNDFEAKVLSTDINESIERHFHGENPMTPFLSVSTHEDVAIAVGRHFGKKSEGKKFYLFKLKVPEIDLIHYTEHGIRKPSKLRDLISNLSISVDDKTNEYEWDKEAESYIFWKIDPNEILEVTQPKVNKTSWNNSETIGEY